MPSHGHTILEDDAHYWTEDHEDSRELEAELDDDPEDDIEPLRKNDDREGSGTAPGNNCMASRDTFLQYQ